MKEQKIRDIKSMPGYKERGIEEKKEIINRLKRSCLLFIKECLKEFSVSISTVAGIEIINQIGDRFKLPG